MNKPELQTAIDYINYGIKEGIYEEDILKGKTDEEIIKFANSEMARGDYEAEASYEEMIERVDEIRREQEEDGI
jgi:hypothetical protein